MRRNAGWRQKGGRWIRSLGHRGVRVRLFQKRKGGVFYRDVWVPGVGIDRKSLDTTDRETAERYGEALLAELLTRVEALRDGTLLLGELWRRFSRGAAAWLDNTSRSRKDDEGRAEVLLAHFGDTFDVREMTAADVQTYSSARRTGGIRVSRDRTTKPVGARSVAVDMRLLKAMLRWATTVRIPGQGKRLLDRNPLDGVTVEQEANPRRPVATFERFEMTRAAIHELREAETEPVVRLRWTRLELALVFAEGTGRRIGSIRQLLWSDVDLNAGLIRWRADADKKEREWVVPMPTGLVDQVRRLRQLLAEDGGLPALTGYVFPAETDHKRPVDRDTLNGWLEKAERHAELPKLRGGLWHPYRRAWATARKHHPLKDVAAAGGWRDLDTLLASYMHADHETMLAVMAEPRRVRAAEG